MQKLISAEEKALLEEKIKDLPQEEKDSMRIMFMLGRYTDIEVELERGRDGRVRLSSKQSVDLTSLAMDLLVLWRSK